MSRVMSVVRVALAGLVLAGATWPAVLPAQDPVSGMRLVDVDRVVAMVGDKAILFSEVLEQINAARAQGLQVPPDSAGQMDVARQMLQQMIDEELLVTVARDFGITVGDAEVTAEVDDGFNRVRAQFRDETEFRAALAREGYGTPDEYRRRSVEAAIRSKMVTRAVDTLKALGRMAPVNVTEREVQEAFERLRGQLGERPATVAFRQVVIVPKATEASRREAYRKTDSLRAALEAGADFDSVARVFSQDGSSTQGGDLGWQRRGIFVKPFEDMAFALIPGRISPVLETQYGFHVLRVDRVRPGEVRVRHILLKPEITASDVDAWRDSAVKALELWQAGTPYDTLLARFHDRDEERSVPDFPVDSLPVEYRLALRPLSSGQFSQVFSLPVLGATYNKWVIAQVLAMRPPGEYSIDEYQERVRAQLKQEKSTRRTLDALRREYYVSVRL